MERDGSGALATAYVYGNERLSVRSTKKENGYYLYDGRGSVTNIVSILGERLESYSYDPSGRVMRATSTNRYQKTFYGYNAEGYDPKTGSVYLRARYYNTRTGNFNTKDTYLGNLMEPLSLNRYAYTQGNPVNYQDPSGHDAERERMQEENREWYGSLSDQERAEISNQNKTAVIKYFKIVGALAVLAASVVVTVMTYGTTMPVLAAEVGYIAGSLGVSMCSSTAMSIAGGAIILNEVSFATKKVMDANEVITGENYIKDTLYGGDEDLYYTVEGLQGGAIASSFIWSQQVNRGQETSSTSSGYYQDSNGKWHRPNGEFASNAEVGIKTSDNWYKSTFDTTEDSMNYHLNKHGKGRTIEQYTNDAMEFYNENKSLGVDVTLKDGTDAIKIQTGTGSNKVGGYWTKDGKIVTFWD